MDTTFSLDSDHVLQVTGDRNIFVVNTTNSALETTIPFGGSSLRETLNAIWNSSRAIVIIGNGEQMQLWM